MNFSVLGQRQGDAMRVSSGLADRSHVRDSLFTVALIVEASADVFRVLCMTVAGTPCFSSLSSAFGHS